MMADYSFGYDPEVPAGFQDADLEMAELEQAAYNEGDDDGMPMMEEMAEAA